MPDRPASRSPTSPRCASAAPPASCVARRRTEDELLDAVRRADAAGTPLLVLGGGSNLVVADDGFDGTVVAGRDPRRHASTGDDRAAGRGHRRRRGEPGTPSSRARSSEGWVGVEALSGIPGSVGATPIQNVGAYGQEVAETIASVRVLGPRARRAAHLRRRRLRLRLPHQPLQGATRSATSSSTSPSSSGSATCRRRCATPSWPARSASSSGARAPMTDVRERGARAARAARAWCSTPADHDTWSAGSFFTNPVARRRARPGCPTARRAGRSPTAR